MTHRERTLQKIERLEQRAWLLKAKALDHPSIERPAWLANAERLFAKVAELRKREQAQAKTAGGN